MLTSELIDWLGKADGGPQISSGLFTRDTEIAIAPAQNLKAEWRWIVVGGKVVDGAATNCVVFSS
jgi:hypothetical protein